MQLADIVQPLTVWYQKNARPLPWREDPIPYHVWISEIMLQQTRIEAVIPYYRRFLEAFPSEKVLAAAPEEAVMKYWEGLGYYSRARNIHKAAKAIVTRGGFPTTYRDLLTLPGIGAYTAGAIASICFGEAVPAVDGNVLRVIARLTADRGDVTRPETKNRMTEDLLQIYPKGKQSSLLTQGLMELGERVCIPNGTPACENCPLFPLCLSRKSGLWREIPLRKKQKERPVEEKTVFLFYCRESGRYALRKRPDTGLLASLYEFPNCAGRLSSEDAKAQAEALELLPETPEPLGDAVHVFTHLEWHMTGYLIPCHREGGDFLWETPEEILRSYAMASAFRTYKKELFPDS